jgi:hypothetical protein
MVSALGCTREVEGSNAALFFVSIFHNSSRLPALLTVSIFYLRYKYTTTPELSIVSINKQKDSKIEIHN